MENINLEQKLKNLLKDNDIQKLIIKPYEIKTSFIINGVFLDKNEDIMLTLSSGTIISIDKLYEGTMTKILSHLILVIIDNKQNLTKVHITYYDENDCTNTNVIKEETLTYETRRVAINDIVQKRKTFKNKLKTKRYVGNNSDNIDNTTKVVELTDEQIAEMPSYETRNI